MAYKFITISRQFGSGGRTIAKKLSEALGYAYYDKEIIDNVAEKSGLSKDYIAERGEHAPGKTVFSYGFEPQGVPGVMNGMNATDYLWSIQRQVIIDIVDSKKPSIIVGRCADYILRDRDDVLNVFIYADNDYRKKRIVEVYGETEVKPEKRLSEKDKKRKANYKYYTNREWGDPTNYALCLNAGLFGIDKCVEMIKAIVDENK